MIRIGSSCALHTGMAIGNVVETRILTDGSADWQNVSKYCIANKIYLILTPCVNDGYNKAQIPSDNVWINTINNACAYLKSIGGNKYNCRLSLINEPMKFATKEHYTRLINIATPKIHSYDFLVGAGNEEFITAAAHGNMYQYILSNAQFDILDIHIQGSCDSPDKTKKWTDEVLKWKAYWKKPVDCSEAFYGNIATSSGWNLLKTQLYHAERIGCPNFCNVFNNLITSMFPVLSDSATLAKWKEISFNVNYVQRSQYYGEWLNIIKNKAPIPNIPEVFDMYGIEINYVKPNSKNEETRAVQQIMEDQGYDLSPYGADGIYGSVTKQAIEKWQTDNGLKVDGWVGKETWQWIFANTDTGMLRFMQMLARTARYK
jgi:hypothetical protein